MNASTTLFNWKTPFSFFFIVILLFVLPLLVSAQSPAFQHYHTDHGLASTETYDIVQDDDGYIWIATDNGLSRFNGYEFEHFGLQRGLGDPVVFKIYKDYRGILWFATMSGELYQYRQDSIVAYEHNEVIRQFQNKLGYLKYIHLDRDDVLYAASTSAGLLKIFPDGSWEHPFTEEYGHYFLSLEESALCFGNTNNLEERKRSRQLGFQPFFLVEGQTLRMIKLPLNSKEANGQAFFFYLGKREYLYWHQGTLYHFLNAKINWQRPYPNNIISISRGADGSLLIGHNFKKGLRRFANLDALRDDETSAEWLNGFSVSGIYRDRDGKLWISTLENGIYYLPNEQLLVFNEASGLSGSNITAISVKNEETLFLGLDNGSVYRARPTAGQFQQLYSDPKRRQVFDIVYDHEYRRLWKGSFNLQYLEEGETAFKSAKPGDLAWYMNAFANKKIALNTQGKLWGCNGGPHGFARIERASGKLEILSRTYLWGNVRVHSIFEGLDGRVWVGKDDGLWEFAADSLYRTPPIHPAMTLRIEEITQLADSTLVIGTKGGGLLLWKDSSVVQLTTTEGLASNLIKTLHIDDYQRIWTGTARGLNRISLKTALEARNTEEESKFSIKTFTTADGLPTNEINDITSWRGQVWVATTQGLVQLPPEKQDRDFSPQPKIDQLIVQGEKRPVAALQNLRWYQNDLQLQFLAINYALAGKISYRYRLGEDKPWTITTNRMANYLGLIPGHYHLEVQARNKLDNWSASTITPIIIAAPWWQSWWFRTLGGLVLAGIALTLYKTRTRQLKREADIQRLRAERTQEYLELEEEFGRLKQSALRAQINPHFIFNCLNSIQSYIMEGDRDQAAHYLSRFAKLIRLALNFSLENRISLENDIQMLRTYLELEKMRYKAGFDYRIELADDITPFDIEIPPLLIQPYVENAIIHGLSDTEYRGQVHICYQQKKGYLLAIVTDNGIGIRESRRRKKGNMSLHRSVGISITQRRLELLDPERQKDTVTIKELTDSKGKVLGTQVTVRIPMEKAKWQPKIREGSDPVEHRTRIRPVLSENESLSQ